MSAAEGRLERRFRALAEAGRAGLVTFLTAGDPDARTALEIVRGLPAAGADVIELGMPFSDPVADGPAIQAAGQRALAAGADMPATLELVRAFRGSDDDTPVVLMGYYNPIHAMGCEAFAAAAATAGVDGLIVEDAGRRALFLPLVWKALPKPRDFLAHLKSKAGMAPDHWSETFKAWRFIAEEITASSLGDPRAIWTGSDAS